MRARHEWNGFKRILDLPHESSPPRGWIATANDENLPADFTPKLGYEWAEPFRIARIAEIMESGRRLTLIDMQRLQQDVLSVPALSLVPMLTGLEFPDGPSTEAASRLRGWDHVLKPSAVAATIYVAWERWLRENVWTRVVPDVGRAALRSNELALRDVIDRVLVPDGRYPRRNISHHR